MTKAIVLALLALLIAASLVWIDAQAHRIAVRRLTVLEEACPTCGQVP